MQDVQRNTYQAQMNRKKATQDAKLGMYMTKRSGAQQTKSQLQNDFNRKNHFEIAEMEAKQAKRQSIRDMAAKGRESVNMHQHNKIMQSKAHQQMRIDQEKRLIYKYEKEAQELEEDEERLIQRLQQLQDEEKKAFIDLEQTMVTASLAKRDRLQIVKEVNAEHAKYQEEMNK